MFGQHIDPSTGHNDFGEDADVAVLEDVRVVPVEQRDPQNPSSWGKVGRNEPCPCGSGKKFKHCHGAFG